ncbi:MAG: FtsX-like permease family protein [Acidobacteria bacterium]|nr:FtsX-like permease family protein [Acidobacteriota bacterium]
MRMFEKLRLRLRSLFRRHEVDGELDAELRFHLDHLTQENLSAGMGPEEARRAARRAVGGVELYKEECRDMRRVRLIEDFVRDLRHAVRSVRKSPGFAAVVIATLALGIGANTAIFTIVDHALLQPLDYPDPEQLMDLTAASPAAGELRGPLSAPEYAELRRMSRSFADVGAYATGGATYTTGEVNLVAGDQPLRVRSVSVDAHLLGTLGLLPQQGRLFTEDETEHWAGTLPPPVAILSHELWTTAFSARPLVGQTVPIEGRPHEIVGVMPPGADVMDRRVQVWLPLWLHPDMARQRETHVLYAIARRKAEVSAKAAEAELSALVDQWGERVGDAGHVPTNRPAAISDHTLRLQPLRDAIVGGAREPLWALQAAVGFVLLIVCANLSNLALARAGSRRRELALRTALGASRGRLLRQAVTEGAILSASGGILGLLLADAGLRALVRAYPGSIPRAAELTLDGPALLLALGLSVGAALLFGFVSLGRRGGPGVAAALKEGGRGSAGASRQYARRGLVVAQVACAVMLVLAAGLLVRTVRNLTELDAGFDRSRLVTFSMTLPMANSEADTRAQAYQRVLDGLRSVPGVLGTVAMSGLPPNRTPDAIATPIENYVSDEGKPSEAIDYYQFVMGDYFGTLGVPIVAGRGFERNDGASQAKSVVVNETLAKRLWKDENPLGRRLRPPGWSFGGSEDVWHTVVGVAKDVPQRGVERSAGTEVYLSLDQHGVAPPSMNVVMRTTLPPSALSATVERVVRDVDPAVPVVRLREMESVFAEAIRRPRLLALLLGAFAGAALLLAALGAYGVLSYMVNERRREIGIRVALGATRSDVVGQVLRQGLAVTAIGVVLGLAGALVLNRLIASLLFGVQPTDAGTIAFVVATMAAVALAAGGLPAWRAARVDPNVALRNE